MRLLPGLLLLLATPVLAQFGEKVTVAYVEVPVTVLAKDGAPVRGLTRASFEVRDDGALREIESFDAIDFAADRGAKAVSPLHPASRRNFLLLFDLSYSNPKSLTRAQDAARSFIARSVGGRDLVAVATLDADRGFRFATAFTTDRSLLVAAIKDPAHFRSSDPLQIGGNASVEADPQPGAGMPDSTLNDSFKRARVLRQVEMLSDLALSLQSLAGRKHLVLLSEGFDPRLVQGRGAGKTENQAEEDTAAEHGELWKIDSDKRFGSAEAQKAIQRMADQFRRADAVLHAVDIQGVRVANDVQGGARFNSNEGLFLLANATGGTVFRNSNDIRTELDKLTRQHDVVYILGFRAPVGRAGQFHELKVKVAGVPGARVTHRGGYYDGGAEGAVERMLSAAEVIVNDIAQTGVGLHALAAAFPHDAKTAQVPVVLEIAGADLAAQARNDRATTEVFVYAFDEDGVVRDTIYQRVTLDVAQVGERLRESGVRFYGTLALPPGRYALKTLVRVAETDRMGYQRVDLVVPRAGEVAVVRPLFFADPGSWVMVKSAADDPKAPYPFVLGEDTFIPAPHPALRPGEPRLFAVFVYNADADELTWEIAPQAKLVSEARGEDVTKLLFVLEKVPADVKELTVTIRKKGSSDARTVSAPIEVQ
ncbi:MAG TPA: VWA domain-containing protein [Thermoanaerobaculia bacterium]|nr:VWA domain-containing protein [Thermoanaerobaculia bacterium]